MKVSANVRRFGISIAISLALLIVFSGVASVFNSSAIGVLILPGALLAAFAFPQGIESDYGGLYMVLSAIFDVLLYSLVVAGVLYVREKRRQS